MQLLKGWKIAAKYFFHYSCGCFSRRTFILFAPSYLEAKGLSALKIVISDIKILITKYTIRLTCNDLDEISLMHLSFHLSLYPDEIGYGDRTWPFSKNFEVGLYAALLLRIVRFICAWHAVKFWFFLYYLYCATHIYWFICLFCLVPKVIELGYFSVTFPNQ